MKTKFVFKYFSVLWTTRELEILYWKKMVGFKGKEGEKRKTFRSRQDSNLRGETPMDF